MIFNYPVLTQNLKTCSTFLLQLVERNPFLQSHITRQFKILAIGTTIEKHERDCVSNLTTVAESKMTVNTVLGSQRTLGLAYGKKNPGN